MPTFIDSNRPSSILGLNVPQQKLSKHSYNIIGMYEKGKYLARIAISWKAALFHRLRCIRPVVYGALTAFLLLQTVAHAEGPDKPLLFLGNENLAPVVYLENGQPTGLAVDLVRALEPVIGHPVTIECMNWATAQEWGARGEADALIQINHTEERARIYDFSKPLLQSQFSIFTQSSRAGITDISSLRGLQVGVEKGGFPHQLLKDNSIIRLAIIPDFLEGFRMLQNGELDVVVVDYRVGAYVLAKNHIDNIKVSGKPIAYSESAIAVKKGNKALLAAINRGLEDIRRDGTYARIISKWEPKEVIFLTKEQILQPQPLRPRLSGVKLHRRIGSVRQPQQFDIASGQGFAQTLLQRLEAASPDADPRNSFAFLMIDGLLVREEPVARTFQNALGVVLNQVSQTKAHAR